MYDRDKKHEDWGGSGTSPQDTVQYASTLGLIQSPAALLHAQLPATIGSSLYGTVFTPPPATDWTRIAGIGRTGLLATDAIYTSSIAAQVTPNYYSPALTLTPASDLIAGIGKTSLFVTSASLTSSIAAPVTADYISTRVAPTPDPDWITGFGKTSLLATDAIYSSSIDAQVTRNYYSPALTLTPASDLIAGIGKTSLFASSASLTSSIAAPVTASYISTRIAPTPDPDWITGLGKTSVLATDAIYTSSIAAQVTPNYYSPALALTPASDLIAGIGKASLFATSASLTSSIAAPVTVSYISTRIAPTPDPDWITGLGKTSVLATDAIYTSSIAAQVTSSYYSPALTLTPASDLIAGIGKTSLFATSASLTSSIAAPVTAGYIRTRAAPDPDWITGLGKTSVLPTDAIYTSSIAAQVTPSYYSPALTLTPASDLIAGIGKTSLFATSASLTSSIAAAVTADYISTRVAPTPDPDSTAATAAETERLLQDARRTIDRQHREMQMASVLDRIHEDARPVLLRSVVLRAKFAQDSCSAFVLSVDLRRSTELMSKARTADEFARFVTSLCIELKEIILQHYGVFDKFTGDGVLAYFPDFFSGPDAGIGVVAAADACHAAFTSHYREARKSFTSVPLNTGLGIGIDYGAVRLAQVSRDLTVIGAPVVSACRFSSAPAGTTFANQRAFEIISEKFGAFCFTEEDRLEVKHEGPMLAYRVRTNGRKFVLRPPDWLRKESH